jgi:hypothetical protein
MATTVFSTAVANPANRYKPMSIFLLKKRCFDSSMAWVERTNTKNNISFTQL